MPLFPARWWAIFIILAYLVAGTLFAWRVPAWQAPDEPAHYNYIAQIAAGDILPVIEMGDWDNAYLNQLRAEDFRPALLDDLATVQYENHQPPLYYWLLTPVYVATDGNLFALRMVSVLLGAVTVTFAFLIGSQIFPSRPHIALAAMTLVPFIPQNMHILASINNDALAGVMIAWLLWLCVRYLKQHTSYAPHLLWWMGLVLGLIVITKTTAYFMSAVVALVVFLRWTLTHKDDAETTLQHLIWHYGRIALPASVFAMLYWGRNIVTYGFPDFLGLQAHDEIVVGQLRRVDYMAEIGEQAYWREAFSTTYHSFWGQFGWMEARLADAVPIIMWVISGVLILAVCGLLVSVWQGRQSQSASVDSNTKAVQGRIWAVLVAMLGFALAQYVYYNATFVQFQGRYLFVAVIPFALCVTTGLDTVCALSLDADSKWSRALFVSIFALLIPLNVYLIWRVIPCAVGCL